MQLSHWCIAAVGIVGAAGCVPTTPLTAKKPSARLLDSFDEVGPWRALSSDGVKAVVDEAPGADEGGMRLDVDLGGVAGWAAARRRLPLDLPANFEISFLVRGRMAPNNLEFKLIDATGENVWWYVRRDFDFSAKWRQVTIRRRQIDFAWGPTQDRALKRIESIELVVAAGTGGGAGFVVFDQLQIRPLPQTTASAVTTRAEASSSREGAPASFALDGRMETAWQSEGTESGTQTFSLDFGGRREFGGLVLRWAPGMRAVRYDVRLSDDRASWRLAKTVRRREGDVDFVRLPESEARFVRLDLKAGEGSVYGLRELQVQALDFGRPNSFIQAVAAQAPRGRYPRGFVKEQSYWTLIGTDGGAQSGLFSEDGAVEFGLGSGSVEPFVHADGQLVSWADVERHQALVEDYLPMPSVTWRHQNWSLEVSALQEVGEGTSSAPMLVMRYRLRNHTPIRQRLRLVLAVRPFQVNAPSQFLNRVGGVSPTRSLHWNGEALAVDGRKRLWPLDRPDRVGLSTFQGGGLPAAVLTARESAPQTVEDPEQLAEGALVYRVDLPASGQKTITVVASSSRPRAQNRGQVHEDWRRKLNRVQIRVPRNGQPLIDALRTSLAYILMTRSGAALRPGTRSYARSWIRDGAMMSSGLLRLGHGDVAKAYFRWYAPQQFERGKVPCCIDQRGADPVAEHDSHGQLIFLAAEIYRYTGDRVVLEQGWRHVEAAARYIETLRQSERTPVNRTAERRHLYGLLPPSISHEGYASKPAYSYWDNFWALRGLKDAAFIAGVLGRVEWAEKFGRWADEFRNDVLLSIERAAAIHEIGYMPGAADRGDFDATSTTVALAPGGEFRYLPKALLRATFERYWRSFVERRDGLRPWNVYTPYELRTVGTFCRFGWRSRANALLAYFLADRRPEAWNQWPEVIGRDRRDPIFVGDMPHGWVASDYLSAVLDLMAYHREADQSLVVAAGVPTAWFEGSEGFSVKHLQTPFGALSYTVEPKPTKVVLRIHGPAQPPGGFVVPSPWEHHQPPARIGDERARWRADGLHIASAPARVEILKPKKRRASEQ